jgi:hypothetical protein
VSLSLGGSIVQLLLTGHTTGAEDTSAADPDSGSEAGKDEVTNDDDSGAGDATTDDSGSEDRPPAYDSD